MKTVKKLALWFWLLSKRLYRKLPFLAILVLIPVLVFGYSTIDTDDSGMVTIALAQEGPDELAAEVIATLREDSQLIRFRVCSGPDEAEDLVRAGKADAAWIFPEQMRSRVAEYVDSPTKSNAIVTVLEREDTVALMLAREKLSGVLFSCCSQTLFLSYIRESVPKLAELPDDALLDYYQGTGISDELFSFADVSGGENMVATRQVHYLMAPLRGLLAVVIVLSGLATAMYYIQDTQKGTFAWVPENRRPAAELGCQIVSVANVSVTALVSLLLAGMAAALWREALVLVLYCLCTAVFCMALRRLCGSVRVLGAVLPLLLVAMLLVCPIFFDLGALRQLQLLFPPTYYIQAVYNDRYLWYTLLYTLCAGAVYWLLGMLFREKGKI